MYSIVLLVCTLPPIILNCSGADQQVLFQLIQNVKCSSTVSKSVPNKEGADELEICESSSKGNVFDPESVSAVTVASSRVSDDDHITEYGDENHANPRKSAGICSIKPITVEKQMKDNAAETLGLDWCIKAFEETTDYTKGALHHSGKMTVLLEILQECKLQGEKILVFSQSVNTLDKIEEFIRAHNNSVPNDKVITIRLDGSTPQKERHTLVCQFNTPGAPETAFLISTKAGGVGLNLIAATRVIIFDSSWNPSSDSQVFSVASEGSQLEFNRCHSIQGYCL